jgi:hypothetical protein
LSSNTTVDSRITVNRKTQSSLPNNQMSDIE